MDLIDTEEAAATLGVSTSWLTKLRVRGNGPTYRKLGRRVLYRRDELTQWVECHSQRSTSENST